MTFPRVMLLRNGAIVTDPTPGAVAIHGSVGQGGANSPGDTRAVQVALNAVPAALGGAGDSLDEDGLVGPLTIGAITTFQTAYCKIKDGRCDPRGPTLALLNAMAGVGDALPQGVAAAASGNQAFGVGERVEKTAKKSPPSAKEKAAIQAAELRQQIVDHHHMGVVYTWLARAIRVADAAERHAQRLVDLGGGANADVLAELLNNPVNRHDRVAFLLVAKLFKLHERRAGEALAGARRVDSILHRSATVISTRVPWRPPVVSPAPPVRPLFVSLFGQPRAHPPGTLGYATRGGLHLKPGPDGHFNPFIVPGQVVQEHSERIYLPPHYDTKNADLQRMTLIHELAHYVGSPHNRDAVVEIATVDEPEVWKGLTSHQRLHTADGYGFLATECGIGTERAVTQCESTMDAIGEWPKVTAGFVAQPDVALPPAGSPEAEKFAFPAGFA